MDLMTYVLAKKAIASESSSGDAGILTKIQNIEANVEDNSKKIEQVTNNIDQLSNTVTSNILPFLSNTVSAIKIGERIIKPVNNILELQIGTGDIIGTPADSEDAMNKISINEDRTMEVNTLSSDKLVSGEEVLIFNSNYEKYF